MNTRGTLTLLMLAAAATAAWAEGQSDQSRPVYLDNGLIRLEVVPEIGGRIMRYQLGDYQYLLVNRDLEGKRPPATRLAKDGSWLNYGGDKLWIAPQGWNGEDEWPGPPDTVLDGGPYELEILDRNRDGSPIAVRLTSEKGASSGVQLSRTIRIFPGNSKVSFEARMTNVDSKSRRWGLWTHTQLDATNRHGDGFNPKYRAYCPLNPKSVHARGYQVMFGLAQNPSFRPDHEGMMMNVQMMGLVGKIGLDSHAGWVATVDGTDGYAFVQRFQYQQDCRYPDDASVEFWLDGKGQIFAYNELMDIPEPKQYGFESELIGPYEELQPGQSAVFEFDWYAARVGVDRPVTDCSDLCVTCEPLSASHGPEGLSLQGRFGVFHVGKLGLAFQDTSGKECSVTGPLLAVTPTSGLSLSELSGRAKAPDDTVRVSVIFYDMHGRRLGDLASVGIR